MIDWPGRNIPNQIGLCDEVFPLRRVAIARQGVRTILRGSGTIGKHVNVDFIIVTVQYGAGKGEIVRKFSVQPQLGDMCLELGTVHAGYAEKLIAITANRTVGLARHGSNRRHATVGDAVVIYIFIRQTQFPVRTERNRQIRVPRITFAANKITVAIELFINRIQPHCGNIAQRRVEVGGKIISTKAVDARLARVKNFICNRRFLHTVDDAATTAATEDQGIRAFEYLDTVDVVKSTIILDVVADTIDEEVGSGVLSAQGNLVAVAFALPYCSARYIAQYIGKAVVRLVVELFARYNIDRLRHVDKWRVGFGRSDRV